jgi:hypothetical protein
MHSSNYLQAWSRNMLDLLENHRVHRVHRVQIAEVTAREGLLCTRLDAGSVPDEILSATNRAKSVPDSDQSGTAAQAIGYKVIQQNKQVVMVVPDVPGVPGVFQWGVR